jgi:ferredoxin
MGSGGMVVMDETTCMVDIARFFLSFTQDESCGKCTFCRIGTKRMMEILEKICGGTGTMDDIQELEDLAHKIKKLSLCGLGQTAPNPVISTLRYFRDEYIAHVEKNHCPAGVCKTLCTYTIDQEKCTGCHACVRVCPVNAISGEVKKMHTLDNNTCVKCGMCNQICRFDAITVLPGGEK